MASSMEEGWTLSQHECHSFGFNKNTRLSFFQVISEKYIKGGVDMMIYVTNPTHDEVC
jgi:hypothetical protein